MQGVRVLRRLSFEPGYVVLNPVIYRVFHRFRQAKFVNGDSILSSTPFLLLPQLTGKARFDLKMVKFDSKIIVSLPKI